MLGLSIEDMTSDSEAIPIGPYSAQQVKLLEPMYTEASEALLIVAQYDRTLQFRCILVSFHSLYGVTFSQS